MNKLFLYLTLSSCLLTGCADRSYYSESYAWDQASVKKTPDIEAYEVTSGIHTVFKVSAGYSHGIWTTAHPSHDTIFMICKDEIETGEKHSFSVEDQTLLYEGYNGRKWFWDIDERDPIKAVIDIVKITDRSILANVDLDFMAISEKGNNTRAISIKKKIPFGKKSIRDE